MIENSVKLFFDMHTKSGVAEAIQEILPQNSSRMGLEIGIDEWGPATIARIQKIRANLDTESDEGH